MTATLTDSRADALPLVTCPSCHTPHGSLTEDTFHGGDSWVCVRCGQRWNAHRLETVAAYDAWVAERERA
jgi:predicted CXXCH cytochrome family protein